MQTIELKTPDIPGPVLAAFRLIESDRSHNMRDAEAAMTAAYRTIADYLGGKESTHAVLQGDLAYHPV